MDQINYLKKQVAIIINLYNTNKYEEVIAKSNFLIKKYPNQILFYNAAALSLAAIGKNEDAMNCFTRLFNFDSLDNTSLDSLILHLIDWCGNDYVNSYADQTLTKKPNDRFALKIKEYVVLNENSIPDVFENV